MLTSRANTFTSKWKKILGFSFARLENSMETRHGQNTLTEFVIITPHVQRVQVK